MGACLTKFKLTRSNSESKSKNVLVSTEAETKVNSNVPPQFSHKSDINRVQSNNGTESVQTTNSTQLQGTWRNSLSNIRLKLPTILIIPPTDAGNNLNNVPILSLDELKKLNPNYLDTLEKWACFIESICGEARILETSYNDMRNLVEKNRLENPELYPENQPGSGLTHDDKKKYASIAETNYYNEIEPSTRNFITGVQEHCDRIKIDKMPVNSPGPGADPSMINANETNIKSNSFSSVIAATGSKLTRKFKSSSTSSSSKSNKFNNYSTADQESSQSNLNQNPNQIIELLKETEIRTAEQIKHADEYLGRIRRSLDRGNGFAKSLSLGVLMEEIEFIEVERSGNVDLKN